MPRVKSIINIENVVASATLRQHIDLNTVVKTLASVEPQPEQLLGLVFRLKKPRTAKASLHYLPNGVRVEGKIGCC